MAGSAFILWLLLFDVPVREGLVFTALALLVRTCNGRIYIGAGEDSSIFHPPRQETIGIFGKENPSGNVTQRSLYLRFLVTCVVIGLCASLKRFWLGHHLGRRLVDRYHHSMTSVVKKMSLLSEVAYLSIDSTYSSPQPPTNPKLQDSSTSGKGFIALEDKASSNTNSGRSEIDFRPGLMELLEDWNEPLRGEITPVRKEVRVLSSFPSSLYSYQLPPDIGYREGNS
jgi:hypothetical protein